MAQLIQLDRKSGHDFAFCLSADEAGMLYDMLGEASSGTTGNQLFSDISGGNYGLDAPQIPVEYLHRYKWVTPKSRGKIVPYLVKTSEVSIP